MLCCLSLRACVHARTPQTHAHIDSSPRHVAFLSPFLSLSFLLKNQPHGLPRLTPLAHCPPPLSRDLRPSLTLGAEALLKILENLHTPRQDDKDKDNKDKDNKAAPLASPPPALGVATGEDERQATSGCGAAGGQAEGKQGSGGGGGGGAPGRTNFLTFAQYKKLAGPHATTTQYVMLGVGLRVRQCVGGGGVGGGLLHCGCACLAASAWHRVHACSSSAAVRPSGYSRGHSGGWVLV